MTSSLQRSRLILCFCIGLALVLSYADSALGLGNQQAADLPKKRTFEFTYGATVEGVSDQSKVRIWIPVPRSQEFQKVKLKSLTLPAEARETEEKKYGNKMLFLESTHRGNGRIAFQMDFEIQRIEAAATGKPGKLEQESLERFLQPNQLVPVDGKPVETFKNFLQKETIEITEDPVETGRVFYDFVEDHLNYDKTKPGYGSGDSNWACDSRTGNCTDFHSLFISVARANKIPAQFRIGFPIPEERGQGDIGGYHCWAFFLAGDKGWLPVDISEADKDPSKKDYYFGNLSENRVQFTTGRDLVLEPAQSGPPLNYFVYPHVEVDGKPWPKDKVKLKLRYRDLDNSTGVKK